MEVARFIRGKNISDAKKKLEKVIAMETAVPFARYHMDLGHKKGPLGPARFPVKTAREILRLLTAAEMNALQKGLDGDTLYIFHISAHKGSTQFKPGRHRGRHAKRTHIEIILMEREKEMKEKTTTRRKKK